MHHLEAVHQVCNERCPASYLELLVEFAAVSVQHGQAEWPKVCIETATHRETGMCHLSTITKTFCSASYMKNLLSAVQSTDPEPKVHYNEWSGVT